MFYIKRGTNKANTPRTIRFTESMFNQLAWAAVEYNTSFNSVVLQCCEYAIKNLVKEPKE